jgi:hypothetical protein
MTPGHHLLLHLKNPRIRYPVSRKPAGSPADRDRGIRASIILSAHRARPDADSAGGVLEMKRKQTLAGLSNRK